MNIDYERRAGILLHITSLYSKYGIGDLGHQAYRFADALRKTGARYWQVLPLGPTGYGNSPYSARSCFAGNELFISPDMLVEDGLLCPGDICDVPEFPRGKVDFNKVLSWKLPLLKKAASNFLYQKKDSREYARFKKDSVYWLDDYALFMVLYEKYNDARWYSVWDGKEGRRDAKTISSLKKEKKDEIEIWKALQYLFHVQWHRLKDYVNGKGLLLIGDAPIFAGGDSADTWSHIDIFKTDADGRYSKVSGVPPDNFSATGQLWGTPVYDWKKLEETGFEWWFNRIRHLLALTDVLRIDHFRGFDAYYEIPAKDETAEFGKWVKAPGKKFFKTLSKEFGTIPIIAEDLGLMTESVMELRKSNGLPGMKISQFGFSMNADGSFNAMDTFLPHNYDRDYIAYTGTHDNDTTRGWFDSLTDIEKHQVREYLSCNDREVVWALIRATMLSHADTAIIPMQDILELGNQARMNFPSTCNDKNWSWMLDGEDIPAEAMERFAKLVGLSGRDC